MLKKYLLFLSFVFYSTVEARTEADISYSISDVNNNKISISLVFKHISKPLRFVIPTQLGPSSGAEKGISNLSIVNRQCRFNQFYEQIEINQRLIHVENCERGQFTVKYDLQQVNDSIESANSDDHYLPVINQQYIKFINGLALVLPWYQDQNMSISLKVNNKNASIFSNLKSSGTNELYFNGNIIDFAKSFIYITSEGSKHRRITQSGTVSLSVDSVFDNTDQKWHKLIQHTIENIAANLGGFSNDKPFYAVLSGLNSDNGWTSVDGIALTDLFWLQATTEQSQKELSIIFIHEILHTWLPNNFPNANNVEPDLQFFTEGFVDYLALLVAMEEGVLSRADFNERINQAVVTLKHSKFASLTMGKWLEYYNRPPSWLGNRDLIYKVPYHKGLLLALKWDEELKSKDSSLLLVLRKMINQNLEINIQNIEKAFTDAGIEKAPYDVTAYIYNNKGPQDFQSRYGHCEGSLRTSYDIYDLGFEENDGNPLEIIDKASNAYLAGLRKGMLVTYSQIAYGNPEQEVTIKTNAGELFKFMPNKTVKELTVSDTLLIPLQSSCHMAL